MDHLWNKKLENNLSINRTGQSAIEYLLLLAVISLLSFTVLKSKQFEGLLGSDAEFFVILADKWNFSYRHGHEGSSSKDHSNYQKEHELYYETKKAQSRFFSTKQTYP